VLIVCSTYLGIASKYRNDEQLSTLERNTTIISKNSEKILSQFSGKYNSGEEIDISPLSMICNTINNMSAALDADIFIINMNGEVVVCKEMMSDRFRFDSKTACVVHGGYKIDQSIINAATDKDYTEVGRLGTTFVRTQITAASPIKINRYSDREDNFKLVRLCQKDASDLSCCCVVLVGFIVPCRLLSQLQAYTSAEGYGNCDRALFSGRFQL